MEKEKILSFRTEKELWEKIEYLEKNMSMSKSQICNLLIKQGLNYFSCQDEILEIISKIEKSEEKRILYLFLTLSQIKSRIKLRGKELEKCLLSKNYSWKQDIEIRVKRKKSNRQVDG